MVNLNSIRWLLFIALCGAFAPICAQPSTEPSADASTIALNFQTIPVRTALQILAEMMHKNVVISDGVTGDISLNLEAIPVQQALTLILQTQGLTQQTMDDTLWIAPTAEIIAKKAQQQRDQQALEALQPTQQRRIPIHYADANAIATLLTAAESSASSASERIQVDSRTNSVLITASAERIQEILATVATLDQPAPQVLIEARIVLVDNRFQEELGIRWGLNSATHLKSSLAGAHHTGETATQALADRLNVNLPANPINGTQPASVALSMINIGDGVFLDLELSALESEGRGKVISSPRLVTANRETAAIRKGSEIPFEESTSSGATATVFKEAALSLEVTPQITPDEHILMQLQVNQDQPSRTLDVKGVPAIDTREIKTSVRVKNGETLVLGGIYEQEKSQIIDRVPFLGAIPGLGRLFSSRSEVDNRSELLIFITPSILTEVDAST